MIERRRIVYSGRVQGVGFRYTTQHTAAAFEVDGYVRNRDDGTVEVQMEGRPEELDRFQSELAERMSGNIVSVKSTTGGATGEFSGFVIRY